MAAHRYLPSDATLLTWRDVEGLTGQQIADRVNETNRAQMPPGEYRPVSRSAVAVALHRAGETGRSGVRTRDRYDDYLPWTPIRPEDDNHYCRQMLRLAARQDRGLPLRPEQQRRLRYFVEMLRTQNAVIDYDPDRGGFYKVFRRDGIDTGLIRVPAVTVTR